MTKRDIIDCGISGIRFSGFEVARVKRGSDWRVLVLRHVWPESTDGRVWTAVRLAIQNYALDLSRKNGGKSVDVYAKDGVMLDQYRAEVGS